MDRRFFIDPTSGLPQIYGHDVTELEVSDVLDRPYEDRPGADGARVAVGETRSGRYVRVIYVPDRAPGGIFLITAYELGPKARKALRRRLRKRK